MGVGPSVANKLFRQWSVKYENSPTLTEENATVTTEEYKNKSHQFQFFFNLQQCVVWSIGADSMWVMGTIAIWPKSCGGDALNSYFVMSKFETIKWVVQMSGSTSISHTGITTTSCRCCTQTKWRMFHYASAKRGVCRFQPENATKVLPTDSLAGFRG